MHTWSANLEQVPHQALVLGNGSTVKKMRPPKGGRIACTSFELAFFQSLHAARGVVQRGEPELFVQPVRIARSQIPCA